MLRTFTLYLSALLFLLSCSPTRLATISSDEVGKDSLHQLVVDNDSLHISYLLSGYGAPVRLRILNKLAVPLELRWQESAVVDGGNTYPLYRGVSTIAGELDGTAVRFGGSTVDVAGTVTHPPAAEFVPPGATIERTLMALPLGRLGHHTATGEGRRLIMDTAGFRIKGERVQFTTATSPLRFRLYLAARAAGQPFTVDRSFYISEVTVGPSARELWPHWELNRADRFTF